jgi:hypothetical protein
VDFEVFGLIKRFVLDYGRAFGVLAEMLLQKS